MLIKGAPGAVLRLFPRPRDTAVAFCAVAEEDAALGLFRRFRERDDSAVNLRYTESRGTITRSTGALDALPPITSVSV